MSQFLWLPPAHRVKTMRGFLAAWKANPLGVSAIVLREPKFAYSYARLCDVENQVRTSVWEAKFSNYAFEVQSAYRQIGKVFEAEQAKGYCPGSGVNVTHLLLYCLIRWLRPAVVIETGVAAGVSSYFFLKAISKNEFGALISVDVPNYTRPNGRRNADRQLDSVYTPQQLGVGWMVPPELRNNWRLLLGDSTIVLPGLAESPSFFYHDSDHTYSTMTAEYEYAYQAGASVIASDDISWNAAWKDFANRHELRWFELGQLGFAFTRNISHLGKPDGKDR